MPAPLLDLGVLAKRLADRKQGRTEANVQSDLHLLLAVAPLNLDDDQIRDDIVLEAQAGDRRRIDVEIGATVFEVKRAPRWCPGVRAVRHLTRSRTSESYSSSGASIASKPIGSSAFTHHRTGDYEQR